MGFPRGRIVEQLIVVLGFEGNASFTLGYINLDLTIGHIQEATRFPCYTCSHLVSRAVWETLESQRQGYALHVPSCLKVMRKDKKAHENASKSSFQKVETYFSKVAFFDVSKKWRSCSRPISRCVSIGMEGSRETKTKIRRKASTSFNPPRPLKLLKFNKKKRSCQKKKLRGKIKLGVSKQLTCHDSLWRLVNLELRSNMNASKLAKKS